ncbi:MAG: hypothetical protein RLZZ347_547 [Candidatus Parcubacteria bacterium]|jgi:CheY-like chemotaxis protein
MSAMDTNTSKKKVLIVEDDKFFMDLLVKRLSGSGFAVVFSQNGKSGLEMATTEKPDVILLDILLPDMDGFEILTKLKEAKNPAPAIFLSNLGSREQLQKAKDLGVTTFMIKATVSLDNIVNEVKKAIGM